MKEIWKEFKEKTANAWKDFVRGIKEVLRSTFSILKDGCKDFITAVFKWLWEVLCGTGLVIKSLVLIVLAAFIAAIKATLGLAYKKVMAWIEKW